MNYANGLTAITCLLAAFVAAAAGSDAKSPAADGRVETRRELLRFAEGRSIRGRFRAVECNCPYRLENGRAIVTCANERVRLKPSPLEPQRPFPGPANVVVMTDVSPTGGKAVLRLRLHGKRGASPIEFNADWNMGVATFDTKLPPGTVYAFDSIDFVTPGFGKRYEFTILKVEGVTRTSKAAALGMEVETPGKLHTLDWNSPAEAVAVISNRAACAVSAQGELEVRDFYGRAFKLPVEVNLAGGGKHAVRLPRTPGKADAKGVWRVIARLRDTDGGTCTMEDRFAILDEHVVTPKIPYGSFRMGIHCHSACALDADRELIHDAVVRMGGKIVRIDYVFSSAATWSAGKKDFDFTTADSFLDGLERRGLAVDALIAEDRFAHFTGDFCTRLAERYRDRLDYYEVGNEWDLAPKEVLTPAQGVEWQKLAYTSLKKGFPKARVTTNGWAVEDSNGHANVTQKGFQETFMRDAAGFYDIHAMHLHFPFANYVARFGRFFDLRKACGVTAPFLLNETALNIQYRGEEEVAENVWLKIIYGWAKGATDYIWYNMRASQFDPGGTYGVISHTYRPRLTFAAFSALTATLGEHDFVRTLVEKDGRKMYLFRRRGGGELVIAGWDAGALKPGLVTIATDAREAYVADMMNNRRRVAVEEGKARIEVSGVPQAWIFKSATTAEPFGTDILETCKAPPRVIKVSPVRPDYGWDMLLDKYAQVHEEYPADPATAHRTWKGTGDLSGILLFTCDETNANVLVSVKDERDMPGDRIEIWRDGKDITATLALVRTRHGDNRTTYSAAWPDRRPCRVNVRFIDDDGFGGIDGWIDYVPFDPAKPDVLQWPIVRWAARHAEEAAH